MNAQHLNSSLKKNSLRSHSNDINQKLCYFYKKRHTHTQSSTETENKPERCVERDHEMHTGRGGGLGRDGEGMRDSERTRGPSAYLLSAYYVAGTFLNSGIEQKINDTKTLPLGWHREEQKE